VTTIAYAHVAAPAGLGTLQAELSVIAPADTARQAELAAAVRSAILQTPVPSSIISAVETAYQALGQDELQPVAVRSCAAVSEVWPKMPRR
jgi:phosphoenolpyruvate synthase/pyruvate phosphate dikinase